MERCILDNGIKLIYSKRNSELTSITIGLDAGAVQDGKHLGIAHATEHMVYKGTAKRTEADINKDFSKLFGFSNAMTNYPYVIYYGSLLFEDFEKGIELFSDVLMNAAFPKEGFKEEMDVIIQELNEWDEELDQYCEDKLFFNGFNTSRLKYPIIGRVDSLNNLTLENIREFYKKYYSPKNTSIAVVSSLEFAEVKAIVSKYFGKWEGNDVTSSQVDKGEMIPKVFRDKREGNSNCRVQIVYPIKDLNKKEMQAFKIFNEYFGEGINSKLFDELRTKNGLVYDVLTKIAYEKHIGLYKIMFSTSKEKVDKALELINAAIYNIEMFSDEKIDEYLKSIRLKKLFREEQSIILSKELATFSVMFDDVNLYTDTIEKMDSKFIYDTAKKVLKNPSIEIIS
ncbi:MAG: pitrilysin family protein [Clostridiaceae bacterium]|nr:pitrilysin family protein [Clostridiaceae bacterium]